MPRPLTEQERQEFLAEPHVRVLSVAGDADRPPLTVPVWYGYQPSGTISFFTGTQNRKARKTRLPARGRPELVCTARGIPVPVRHRRGYRRAD